ncbi:RNase H domain-containing protein [Trichonephila inaurata madagascariensis]|uniref:RNase H domain-containing protein n=1 Tax=Trichonephila inaurata madagascariensis TaxID=2747483 RepID=A0A8X6I5S8_9ARAC|nr:RNase H domain-containing protein [Trichonephila inaurata madagascariensis]
MTIWKFLKGCHAVRDSRAVLLTISSSEALASVDILKIHLSLNDLMESHEERFALQWVPAHCGLQGNETADSLTNKASKIAQISDKQISFYTTKWLIKKSFRETCWKNTKEANKDKKCIEEITNIPSWPRDRSVATFRFATVHDCLS